MANEESIDQIIDQAAFDQVAKLKVDIEQLNKTLAESIRLVLSMKTNIADANTFGKLNKETAAANILLEKANKINQQAAILEEKKQQAIIKTNALKAKEEEAEAKRQISREQREKKQTAIDNAKIVREAKRGKTIISNSQDEIDAYNNTVNGNKKVTSAMTATAAAENLVSSKGNSLIATNTKVATSTLKVSQAAVNAQKSINSLKIQLESYKAIAGNAIDPAILETFNAKIQETESTIERLGNIGKIGFDELGNAVDDTGGGVGDAYGKLKEFAAILPGIGVAGLIAFASGPIIDYIVSLDLFGEKISELVKRRSMLNDVNLQGAKDAQMELVQLKTLYDTAKNIELSSKQRYNAAKALQEQYPETFKNLSVEQIELGKVGAAYDRLTKSIIATARARASQDKIAENSIRQLDDEQRMLDLQVERAEIVQKETSSLNRRIDAQNSLYTNAQKSFRITDEQRKVQLAQILNLDRIKEIDKEILNNATDRNILESRNLALAKNVEAQQKKGANIVDKPAGKDKINSKIDTSNADTEKEKLETIRDAAKQIAENEQESLDIRLQSLEIFTSASADITRVHYDKEVQKAKGNAGLLKVAQAEFENNYLATKIKSKEIEAKINAKAEKELVDIFKNGSKEIEQIAKDEAQALLDGNNEKLASIELYRSQAAEGVADQYADGKVSKQQYEDELYDIEAQAAQDRINLQIETLRKILDLQRANLAFGIGTQKQISENEAKLAAFEVQTSEIVTKGKIRNNERVADERKQIADKEKELARELLNFTTTLLSATYENQLNAVRDQMDLNEQRKSRDIENVNNSLATEEEKADKIAIINAKASAQEDLLEQKQRDIKNRQAKADRAGAIAGIIMNIALAQAKTLGQTGIFGLPLIGIIAALGAVQIATILATPIPKYKSGTNSSKQGFALTDEVGPELYLPPSGTPFIGSDQPNIKNLQAGTRIIPHHELVEMMAKPAPMVESRGVEFDLTKLIAGNEKIYKAIKSGNQQKPSGPPPLSKKGLYETNNQSIRLMEWQRRNI